MVGTNGYEQVSIDRGGSDEDNGVENSKGVG